MKTRLLLLFFLICVLPMAAQQSRLDIAILGDSNTWLGGDDCTKEKGWNKWFKDLVRPRSCTSYARSGATWTNTPRTKRNTAENIGVLGDDNVIFNQVNRLLDACESKQQATPQLVVISAGTNDLWFASERPNVYDGGLKDRGINSGRTEGSGSINSGGTATFTPPLSLEDCIDYEVSRLREAFPEVEIVLLTPMQTVQVKREEVFKMGDLMQDICKRLKIHCIRLDKSGIVDSRKEQQKRRYTYDGTHTSKDGARANAEFIFNKMTENGIL